MRQTVALAMILTAAACLWAGQGTPTRQSAQDSVKTSQITMPNGNKYTISKETTLIDGPMNIDGTINYLQAYNTLISKGVTRDNNAAVLILRVMQTPEARPTLLALLEELNVPPLVDKELVRTLDDYAARSEHPPKQEEIDAMVKATREKPWKSRDYPLAAQWLESCEPGAKLLDEAFKRPRLYMPFISKQTPPIMTDAMPSYASLRVASLLLAARASHRAGEGDIQGALGDIGRLRTFARLSLQLDIDITSLIGLAVDVMALHALQGIVLDGEMSNGDLVAAKKIVESLPSFEDAIEGQPVGEHLYALDIVMQFMRGNGGIFLSQFAGDTTGNTVVARNDLDSADWDAWMKELTRVIAQEEVESHKSLTERLSRAERLLQEEKADMRPASTFLAGQDELKGADAIGAYLKQRAKESNVEYSQRLGRWFETPSAGTVKQFVFFGSRYKLDYEVCKVLILLQQYRLAHESYPAALKDLGVLVLQDPSSGKDINYRREGDGFVVWGVGNNMKDDGATGDDMIYRGRPAR